jgi:Spy/CpxP family protein refolding chaperone
MKTGCLIEYKTLLQIKIGIMKETVKFFGLMLIALMIMPVSRVSAQRHQHPGPPRGVPDSAQVVRMVDHLAQDLSLSNDQKEKITKLQLAHFAKMKDEMEKKGQEKEQNREEMEELRNDFQEQMLQVLNDEQKAKFKELQKKRFGPGGRPGDSPGDE